MKVKIKSWERMVEEFGYKFEDVDYIDVPRWCWHTELEDEIPDNRIIEVSIKLSSKDGLEEKDYYYMGFGVSEDAIEEYLTDELGNDLTNPLHPVNYELLADFGIEQKFKLKPIAEILEEESCQKVDEVSLDSLEHPASEEWLPELDGFNQAKARENLLKFCDKATLTNNNLAIFKQIQNKSHLCHYTKFQLDYDINTSIRFIHAFDDRPELVGKFIYKHHEEKLFSVIEPQLAEHFIKTQCSNEAEEFINRYVGQGKGKKYRRIKVTENSLTKYFES